MNKEMATCCQRIFPYSVALNVIKPELEGDVEKIDVQGISFQDSYLTIVEIVGESVKDLCGDCRNNSTCSEFSSIKKQTEILAGKILLFTGAAPTLPDIFYS